MTIMGDAEREEYPGVPAGDFLLDDSDLKDDPEAIDPEDIDADPEA